MWETRVWFLGREDPLEKEMATHSSTLAWKIPWMEEPGRLRSMGSQRVGHDWGTKLSSFFLISLSVNVQKSICWNSNVFDPKVLSDPSGVSCPIEYMYHVTCQNWKILNSGEYLTPRIFRKELFIVVLTLFYRWENQESSAFPKVESGAVEIQDKN